MDPYTVDPRFTRVRVRHKVLPVLETELGPGVAVALARTADLLRPDMELLDDLRSEEHTSELQSLMRISYAVFCLKNKKTTHYSTRPTHTKYRADRLQQTNNDIYD